MTPVLDHGFVRLVSYMQPAEPSEQDQMWNGDLEVVRNARTSYNADWRGGDPKSGASDDKLIRYLQRNHHTSPFEAMTFTFEVKAPIFVFRQWHRHRTWSYNEVSARYTELPEEFYLPEVDRMQVQSTQNKQMSGAELIDVAELARDAMRVHSQNAFVLYRKLLESGLTRELARTVLPLNTYTRMFATVDLHNLLGFIRLRAHSHAQYEIQVYARALLDLVHPIVPATVTAFLECQ